MANFWAIAIGINHYQFFQSLSYAQADAEALRDFLVAEAGFLPEHCLLMTDTSVPVQGYSTYPSQENFLRLIEQLTSTQLQPEDQLWFFFSGYGVNYDGQDYLMPQDGDPNRVVETGIEVRSLYQFLQAAAPRSALVLLDINRAWGKQADALIGEETIELAQELEISTILSCQPEEFSHESASLGHGFFTATLLEALRSGHGNSLEKLEIYLNYRLPELCQHHWRPIQNPVIIIQPPEIIEPAILPQQSQAMPRPSAAILRPKPVATDISVVAQVYPPLPTLEPPSAPISTTATHYKQTEATATPWWQKLLLWVGGVALLLALILAVFLRNRAAFTTDSQPITPAPVASSDDGTNVIQSVPNTPTAQQRVPSQPSSSSTPPPSVAVDPQLQQQNQLLLDQARTSIKNNQASDYSRAIAIARKIPPGEPLYEQAQQDIDRWSRVIFDLARGRANQGNFASAIAAAQLIPKNLPIYPQAQQAIKQWQLAAKQQLSNNTLLEAAAGLIRSRQASSYNRAIDVASKVPPTQPGYAQAQKLINEWSDTILALANQRAAQGRLQAAIATATLVPEGTSADPKAREAIQQWQKKLR